MTKRTRFGLALVLALGAAMASAFQEDKPKGTAFYPEQSQAQVSQQQNLSGKVDPVGTVEERTEAKPSAHVDSSDAGNSFANAGAAAQASFANAASTIKASKDKPNYAGIVLLLVGGLFLAAVAFKQYSDKNVPLPNRLKT